MESKSTTLVSCPHCNQAIRENSVTCIHCGKKVSDAVVGVEYTISSGALALRCSFVLAVILFFANVVQAGWGEAFVSSFFNFWIYGFMFWVVSKVYRGQKWRAGTQEYFAVVVGGVLLGCISGVVLATIAGVVFG